jgi:hypothetical protein
MVDMMNGWLFDGDSTVGCVSGCVNGWKGV